MKKLAWRLSGSQSLMLRLITHYELGNEDLLPHLARAVYRRARRATEVSPLEEILLNFFRRKLSAVQTKADMQQAFTKVKNDRDAVATHPLVKARLMFMDYCIWLQEKCDEK